MDGHISDVARDLAPAEKTSRVFGMDESDGAAGFDLELQEAPTAERTIPPALIDELVALRTRAKDEATNFTDAVTIQAEKYSISKGALRRYVCAVEAGKVDTLDEETEDIARLLLANESRHAPDETALSGKK